LVANASQLSNHRRRKVKIIWKRFIFQREVEGKSDKRAREISISGRKKRNVRKNSRGKGEVTTVLASFPRGQREVKRQTTIEKANICRMVKGACNLEGRVRKNGEGKKGRDGKPEGGGESQSSPVFLLFQAV